MIKKFLTFSKPLSFGTLLEYWKGVFLIAQKRSGERIKVTIDLSESQMQVLEEKIRQLEKSIENERSVPAKISKKALIEKWVEEKLSE